MTAKEYLSQAKYLDMRINSKIQQVEALNELATSATSALTGMPHNPNKATSKMADAVAKIVDLQSEINHDIDALVDLKQEISTTIKAVPNVELQTLLEKRYLCFQAWEKVAVDMGYSMHHL
jgi:seryl-tRNA synthetase